MVLYCFDVLLSYGSNGHESRNNSMMMTLLVMLLLLLLLICFCRVRSLCPNLCSNHGICDDYDRCLCFQNINGEDAWTGYDCSLRTCPR